MPSVAVPTLERTATILLVCLCNLMWHVLPNVPQLLLSTSRSVGSGAFGGSRRLPHSEARLHSYRPPKRASRPHSAAFCIVLPLHLPPTFADGDGWFNATISYEVSVVMRSSGSVLATTCTRVLSMPGPHTRRPGVALSDSLRRTCQNVAAAVGSCVDAVGLCQVG